MSSSFLRRRLREQRGQGTVEYLIVLGIGAILAYQVVSFFVGPTGILTEGLELLEGNIQNETETGSGFK